MRTRWLAVSFLAAIAVVGLAACGSSTTSTPPASSNTGAAGNSNTSSDAAAGIKTTSIDGSTVLTTASGMVLYWFANDTSSTSNCTGTCATYWPPLIGTPSAASGVSLSGALGTIKRSNGQLQATYMGHPLYTYASDTSAGQMTGNDVNLSGGYWWAMTTSGSKISTSSSSSGSSGSGSGGYGY
jgi:predicted lipoprotein with Yx(FWY)xxD motif